MLIEKGSELHPIGAAALGVGELDQFALLRGIVFAALISIALWAAIFEAGRRIVDALA